MSATDEYLTVEEAAARLRVSAATARRMAKDGRIVARKSGKQWLIDAHSLSHAKPRPRRTSARQAVDLDLALAHVRATDLREIWVPDVLQHEDVLSDPAAVLARAGAIFNRALPGPRRVVEIDKSLMLTRLGTLLALDDRVAYQAAVGSFADRVEALTPESVFSSRLSESERFFTKHGARQWVKWRRYVRDQIADTDRWLVKTDLTAYFDTMQHRSLLSDVESLNVDSTILDVLRDALRTWGSGQGIGLPQGPNASRILGNLYLLPVDRAMLQAGWRYSRYMDDIRVVVDSKEDGYKAIRQFQQEARARGLLVSAAKTTLLHGDAARDELGDDAELERAQYLVDHKAFAPARKALRAILKDALKADAGIIERRATFSLWRLTKLRESSTLTMVLNRLEDLAPVARVLAAYIRSFITRPRVVTSLADFLGDPARCQSPYLSTWLFAAMLEHPGKVPARWADQAAERVRDRNQPEFLRAIAAVVMLRGGRPADRDWIKSDISREHNPEVLRGYAVGLHWIHQLDKTTQRTLIARSASLATTVAYLQGRNRVPSLVSRSQLTID
jgi:excisionase family DNA binding protein